MLLNLLFDKPQHEAAVVIPIYKSVLNDYETISLDRCLKVLGKHPTLVIAPEGLALNNIDLLKLYNVKAINFPAQYFASTDDYSRLMLSIDFYKTFIEYNYILIHQLDAFVFSDQLIDWCRRSYDYIGAPWIDEDWLHDFNKVRYGCLWLLRGTKEKLVGNGGFSLRKIRSFLLALMLLRNSAKKWQANEDIFWSFAVPDYNPFFRIPEVDMALGFAFEAKPRECFTKRNQVLPFGCHAWEKHDIDFWRPVFKNLGYNI